MLLTKISTTRNVVIDRWSLVSNEKGIQIQKNGRNIVFCKTVKQALEFLQNCSTMGDTVSLYLEDVNVETLFS